MHLCTYPRESGSQSPVLACTPAAAGAQKTSERPSLRSVWYLTYPALKGRRVPRDDAGEVHVSTVVGGLRLTRRRAGLRTAYGLGRCVTTGGVATPVRARSMRENATRAVGQHASRMPIAAAGSRRKEAPRGGRQAENLTLTGAIPGRRD